MSYQKPGQGVKDRYNTHKDLISGSFLYAVIVQCCTVNSTIFGTRFLQSILPRCILVIGGLYPMTDAEKDYAARCARHNPHAFYIWAKWLHVRDEVLRMDHYECQRCKDKHHRYRAADTVHHINHFKDRPDLALEVWYIDPATHERKRNLISLCHDCHEEVHERGAAKPQEPALTEERWD